MKSSTEEVKRKLRKKSEPKERKQPALSTGLAPLNLACSGKTTTGLLPGHYYLFVGDSQAGKTFLTMQILAEAANNSAYDGYRLIHDNPERGSLMDKAKFFGKRMVERIEPPSSRGSSRTLEEFYDNVDDAVKDGRPFVYVLDSEDALSSEDEIKKLQQNKKIRRKSKDDEDGEKVKGSYGDGKAKKNSSGLRLAHNGLGETGSILIVIKQTRDNIGLDAMFNPKTRSGGRALTFYATLELWFSKVGKVKKRVKGKDRSVGTYLKIHVKKNRVSGRDRAVVVPFYESFGFDDTGACVDFLIFEGHWKKDKGGKIHAPEFDWVDGSVEDLIQQIEAEGKDRELRLLVAEVWNEIERECEVQRKRRYE